MNCWNGTLQLNQNILKCNGGVFMEWSVKLATEDDEERWLLFASKFKEDFCVLDLGKEESYIKAIRKNIMRGTAIYIEDQTNDNRTIIGAMIYSPNQRHIGWLGVHADYRRMGIATALFKHMIRELGTLKEIKVKTFLYDDSYGKAARSFYARQGFIPGEIDMNNSQYPHPVQEFVYPIHE